MTNRRKTALVAGMFLIVLMAMIVLPKVSHAEKKESILKSADIESTGRVGGKGGFYYYGGDVQKLADDLEVLYKSCQ